MMKKNFNFFSAKSFLLLLTLVILFPVMVAAQQGQNGMAQSGGYFCQNIDSWLSRIENRLAERDNQLSARQDERVVNIDHRRAEKMSHLEQKRLDWAEIRNGHYASLEAKAITEAQKQAVAEFKATMEEAVISRHEKINQALVTYRTGVDRLIIQKKQKIDRIVNDYQATILAAGEKAQADCASGAVATAVRRDYRNALATAQDNFRIARQEIDNITDEIRVLGESRKQTVAEAVADFRTILETAKIKLKQSFATSEF